METTPEKKKRYGFVAAPEYPEGGKIRMKCRVAFPFFYLKATIIKEKRTISLPCFTALCKERI